MKLVQKFCLFLCIICACICIFFLSLSIVDSCKSKHKDSIPTEINDNNGTIVSSLNKINDTLNKTDYFDYVFPWLLSTLTSLIAYFASYYITKKTNKKNYQRECTFDYLKYINEFLRDIVQIEQCMINIKKLTNRIIKQICMQANVIQQPVILDPEKDDYQTFVTKIQNIVSIINNHNLYVDKRLKEEWNKCYDILIDFSIFIKIGNNFESNVIHYFYILDKEIVNNHIALINLLASYTKYSLKGFKIKEYEYAIKMHIKRTNEIALGKKLDLLQ